RPAGAGAATRVVAAGAATADAATLLSTVRRDSRCIKSSSRGRRSGAPLANTTPLARVPKRAGVRTDGRRPQGARAIANLTSTQSITAKRANQLEFQGCSLASARNPQGLRPFSRTALA